jgi:hypothetical protein
LDKRFGEKNELVRRQYSGTEHRVLSGIGLVNCVYVNPELGLFWVIDYRIYDPYCLCPFSLESIEKISSSDKENSLSVKS